MTIAADMLDDDRQGAGGLAVLLELPRLLGEMLRWWTRHVLPFLHRPWEAPSNLADRLPDYDLAIARHLALSHSECISRKGACKVHGYRA